MCHHDWCERSFVKVQGHWVFCLFVVFFGFVYMQHRNSTDTFANNWSTGGSLIFVIGGRVEYSRLFCFFRTYMSKTNHIYMKTAWALCDCDMTFNQGHLNNCQDYWEKYWDFFPSENKSKSVSLSSSGKLISRQMQNSSIRLDSHVALLHI